MDPDVTLGWVNGASVSGNEGAILDASRSRLPDGFPVDPQYAHRGDERIDSSALVRSYDVLRRFLAAQEEH
jgi:hypothetical protein